jgi:hypothetical protein
LLLCFAGLKVGTREALGEKVVFSVGLLGAEVAVLFIVRADVEGGLVGIGLKVGTREAVGTEVVFSVGLLGAEVAVLFIVGADVEGGLVGIELKAGTREAVGTEVVFSVGLLGAEVAVLFIVGADVEGGLVGSGLKVGTREAVGTEVVFSVGLLGAEVVVLFIVGADVEGGLVGIGLKVGTREAVGAEVTVSFGVLVGAEVEGELGIEVPVPWLILGASVLGAIGADEMVGGLLGTEDIVGGGVIGRRLSSTKIRMLLEVLESSVSKRFCNSPPRMSCFKEDVKSERSAPVPSKLNSIDAVTFSQRSPSLTNILVVTGQAEANRLMRKRKPKTTMVPRSRWYVPTSTWLAILVGSFS